MPDPSDDELLAEWKRLNDERTPSPWEAVYEGHEKGDRMVRPDEDDPDYDPEHEDILFGNRSGENWRFVMFLGTHSARLLALVERLMAERDSLGAIVERLVNEVAELRYGEDDSDWELPASQGGGE